ncbi:MAG TPA: TonB-dependent receptor [Caulobacteraceae bacterium]|nr:TonB-dependent receptor [Caulobacteraceae bacterium]
MDIRKALLAGAGFGALLAAAAPAVAAEAQNQTATEVETIVVTAEKRAENIQTVPISIQAFSAKDIETQGIKQSIDIGQVVPNVDIAMVAGPGNQPIITMRGIGLNDYDTNNAGPNGVYIDDVYQSSPAMQSFQLFDLQRIEVLKGPQGTLYGRNTSGGLINFITNKPTDYWTGNLHAEYSSFESYQIEGAVGGPLAPALDGRFAFVENHSRGYMHNALTGGPENGYQNWGARAMVQWKPQSDLSFLFNVHGWQVNNRVTEYRHIGDFVPGTQDNPSPTQCSVAASYAGQCVDLFGYNGSYPNFYEGAYNRNQHLKINDLGAYLRAEWQPGYLTFTSITAFEHNDKIHPEDSDASPNRLLEIDFGVFSNEFTQELRLGHTGGRLNWVTGLYYLHEYLKQNQPLYLFLDMDQFGAFGIPAGPGAGDAIPNPPGLPIALAAKFYDRSRQATNSYAIFGQGDYAITDRLKLTLGGRFTYEPRNFHYLQSEQLQMGGENNFGPIIPLANTEEHQSSNAFNYRVALDYKLTADALVYASIASGYKGGDFNGSFLSNDPTQIAFQLQPVKPEHVTAYEGGFKTSWFNHRLIVDAAGFYNEYNDLQVFILEPETIGIQSILVNILDNAKKAHTDGVEAQVTALPIENFTLSAQFGWLQTRLDDFTTAQNIGGGQANFTGNELPVSPHFSMAAVADYRIPIAAGVLDLQAEVNYRSHQFFDIGNDPYITQDGYWLENLRAGYSWHNDRYEVAGWVRNLGDKHYYLDKFDLTVPFGFIQGIVGTPRSFGVEFNVKY